MSETCINGIDMFFDPRSVAIAGASRTPGKLGNTILKNLIKLNYGGQVYPVNPNAGAIEGLKSYPSVAQLPEPVDVVVVAVPAEQVLRVAEDSASRGVKGLIIISSGFNEMGREGPERQRQLVSIARKANMRILGPNTTGVLDTRTRFTSTFLEVDEIREGSVAFIAQTGMFAGMMLEKILSVERFGLSKVVGLGNKSDVADHEVLDFLARDPATGTIMMYVEGVRDGARFLESARRLTPKKPIVVLKGGRTAAGAKAALSHTGSIVGRDEVFEAMCRQAGIIRALDFDDLVDIAKMFAYQPVPGGNRLAVVTLSGAAGVISSDFGLEEGLQLATPSRKSLEKVASRMPVWAPVNNPLDIEPLTEVVADRAEAYRMAVEAVLSDETTDMCLLVMGTPRTKMDGRDIFRGIREKYPNKPIAVCIIGVQRFYDQLFGDIEDIGVPVFPGLSRAVRGLSALNRYRRLALGRS